MLTGLKRTVSDQFFTKKNVVDTCLGIVNDNVCIDYHRDLIIEPSAGNGSFIDGIKEMCKNHIFYDLYKNHPDVLQTDFLDLDLNNIEQYSKIHVVGNPPFGRQSSLAMKFINKSCEFCNTVSFILPKSFKKNSFKKRIHRNFHLLVEIDLCPNSFTIDGKNHDTPCIFQIWQRRLYERELENTETSSEYFVFVKKHEDHDISIRRVGYTTGKIDTNTTYKNENTHYFLKFKNVDINEILDKLNLIDFDEKLYTTGPRSISKGEIIHKFNDIFV